MTYAIYECHLKDICHSDIKLNNFMIKRSQDINSVKLIDFGLSKKCKENEYLY